MKAFQHPSSNYILQPPEGMPAEECEALPVTAIKFVDGTLAMVSFWKPSEDELALLSQGAHVRLIVLGTTHPPLSVSVDGDGLMGEDE